MFCTTVWGISWLRSDNREYGFLEDATHGSANPVAWVQVGMGAREHAMPSTVVSGAVHRVSAIRPTVGETISTRSVTMLPVPQAVGTVTE